MPLIWKVLRKIQLSRKAGKGNRNVQKTWKKPIIYNNLKLTGYEDNMKSTKEIQFFIHQPGKI